MERKTKVKSVDAKMRSLTCRSALDSRVSAGILVGAVARGPAGKVQPAPCVPAAHHVLTGVLGPRASASGGGEGVPGASWAAGAVESAHAVLAGGVGAARGAQAVVAVEFASGLKEN